jgi:DNA-binding transcriptional ArsR family regulator
VTDRLAAIAEPNRRRLLQLLASREQTAGELAARFDVTRSAISQHLGVLIDAGLVARTRDGRFQRYRLAADGMAALRADLDAFWTTELDQLVYDALSLRMTQPTLERQS